MTSVFHFCICLVIDHKFRHNIVVAVDHEAVEIQFYISAFALLFIVLDMFCMTISYSLSHKTVNARENFWNVYCFTTNQMRDETAKDNRQTAEWINYDLTRNNEFAFSSTRNL